MTSIYNSQVAIINPRMGSMSGGVRFHHRVPRSLAEVFEREVAAASCGRHGLSVVAAAAVADPEVIGVSILASPTRAVSYIERRTGQ